MNEKFFDLKKEKQDRIINAALKVFALNGYKRASTDEMIAQAGISKGLLFHYFGSKLKLFAFIYEYSARYVMMEYERSIVLKENDFFEIQKQLEYAKWQIMRKYPYMIYFLNQAFLEDDQTAIEEISMMMDRFSETLQAIYQKADITKFREELEPSKVLKMVLFTMEGLLREQISLNKFEVESLYKESVEYLEICRRGFYKNP